MSSGSDDGGSNGGDPLEAIRSAADLAALARALDADSVHEAYFAARRIWADRPGAGDVVSVGETGLPGARVGVDGVDFWVHGVTHADTGAERAFLREGVARALDRGATVYCEQGIRGMYFDDFDGVCETDDYRWAMRRCSELDVDSHVTGVEGFDLSEFEALREEVDTLASRFREAAFSLIDSGSDVYGERFGAALGDVASDFLVSHEQLATGREFESFALTRAAAEDPSRLADLQRYYERTFLPQPLEREWLRRHDRELEVVTHARNERLADYALYHHETAPEVHLVVGAAHQPGVRYYLEQFRDGRRSLDGFEPV